MVSETKGDFFERDPIFPGISEFYFPIGSGSDSRVVQGDEN